jgi:ABC-type Zn2+ transport system substrate-binding protein/surface adhesin
MPGAERITEIRAKVQELGAACVFAEPQFEPKLVSTVIEGTEANPVSSIRWARNLRMGRTSISR